jgi:hypothetical protein
VLVYRFPVIAWSCVEIGINLKDQQSVLVAGVPDPVNILVQDTLHCRTKGCSPCLIRGAFLSSDPENNIVWVVRVFGYESCLLLGVGGRKGAVLDLGVEPETVLV